MRPSRLNNMLRAMQSSDDKQLKKFVPPEKAFSPSELQKFTDGLKYFYSIRETRLSNSEMLTNVVSSFTSLTDELIIQINAADSKSSYEILKNKIENVVRLLNSIGMNLFSPIKIISIDDAFIIYNLFYSSLKGLRKTLSAKPNKDKFFKDISELLSRKYFDCCDALALLHLVLDDMDTSISFLVKQLSVLDSENIFTQEEIIVRKATIFTMLARNALKQDDLIACGHFLRESYKTMPIEMSDLDLISKYQIGREYLSALNQMINVISDEINNSNAEVLWKLIKALPSKSIDYPPFQKKITAIVEKAVRSFSKNNTAESRNNAIDPADVFTFIDILKRSKQTNIITYADKVDSFISNKNISAIKNLLEGKAFSEHEVTTDQNKKYFIITFKNIPENSSPLAEFQHNGTSYRIMKAKDNFFLEVPVDILGKEFLNLIERLSNTQIFAPKLESAPQIENMETKQASLNEKVDYKEVSPDINVKSSDKSSEEKAKVASKKEMHHSKAQSGKKAQQQSNLKSEQTPTTDSKKRRKYGQLELPDKSFYNAKELGFSEEFNGVKIYLLRSPLYPRLAYCGFYSRNKMEDKLAEEVHVDNEKTLETGKIASKSPCIKYVKKHTFKIAGLTDSRVVSKVVGVSTLFPNVRLLCFDGEGLLINHSEQNRKLYRGKN